MSIAVFLYWSWKLITFSYEIGALAACDLPNWCMNIKVRIWNAFFMMYHENSCFNHINVSSYEIGALAACDLPNCCMNITGPADKPGIQIEEDQVKTALGKPFFFSGQRIWPLGSRFGGGGSLSGRTTKKEQFLAYICTLYSI